jgi:Zn-dependent peptidase ImmA (M78 family)/transcriptional regulator with XRE-family HTH domain
MINGDRVRQAREIAVLTQKELGDRVGVTQSAIAHIETGLKPPSEELIAKIALQTGFPPSYFDLPSTRGFPAGTLLFRAHATITARERIEAYQWAEMIYRCQETMAEQLELPAPRLPHLDEPPELAAQLTRSALGLAPQEPIGNLTRALELAGVTVIALPVSLEKRDAFSLWAGIEANRPVVVLVAGKPGDRLRFNLSHELGHLVRDYQLLGDVADLERQANRFAAEFLLPEVAMRQELFSQLTLATVAHLKKRWGASMQAIIRRAFDLEIISERQHRYLFEQLAWRGWKVHEPEHVPVEMPRAFRQMAEILYPGNGPDRIDFQVMARGLRLTPQRAMDIVRMYAGGAPKARDTARRVVPFRKGKPTMQK